MKIVSFDEKKKYFQLESSSNRQKEALISEQKPKQTEAVEKTIQKAILAVRRCIYTTSRKFHWENYKTCTHRRYRFHCENRKAKQNRRLGAFRKTVEKPKLVRAGAFHFQCNDNFNARGRHSTQPTVPINRTF